MAKSLRSQVTPKINGHKPAASKPAGRNGKAGHASDPFLGDDFADEPFEEFEPVVEELAEEEEAADEHGDDTVVDATDDPVRMYLMQMGEIPLLDRAEEIASAKKIERARV